MSAKSKREAPMGQPGYRTVMQMFDMLRLLQQRGPRGMPVNALAEALDVNRRTIVRYLQALSDSVDNEAGAPIVQREHRAGVAWAVMPGEQGPLTANIYQYAAVFAATRRLPDAALLRDTASGVLDRLEDSEELPLQILQRVASGFCHVPFGPKEYRNEEVLDALVRGVLNQRSVDIVYRSPSADRGSERRLEPWTLVMYRDGLYLLAKTAGAVDQTRPYIYAVERIETAAVARDVVFEVPADFDPQKLFEGRLGIWSSDEPPLPIRLAFAGRAARYARERRWPGHAHWTEEEGRSILELTVPVTPEVVSWIIGWGPDLEVLSPPSLRTQVRERHMAAVARYGAE